MCAKRATNNKLRTELQLTVNLSEIKKEERSAKR